MDGILLVIKPPGMTSFDVVAWIKKVTGNKKAGHAGTLDPGACGLLPVCIGKATKAMEYFQNHDKAYRAEMILGITTDTQDGEGAITEKNSTKPEIGAISAVMEEFIGECEQIPPMFSAVKSGGKRLYDLARKGIEVERGSRKVNIYNITLLSANMDAEYPVVRFDVSCSKGTYIRTLCHDIGQKLGCGAYMSFLVRTRVGIFSLSDGLTLEEIKKRSHEGSLDSAFYSVDILFGDYPGVYLDINNTKKFINGAAIEYRGKETYSNGSFARVYNEAGLFLGLGVMFIDNSENIMIKPEKLFISV